MYVIQSKGICNKTGDELRENETEGSRSEVCVWSGGVTRMDAVQYTHHHISSE